MSFETPRIAIIGLGFLMRYLKPCFLALTERSHLIGATHSKAAIPAKAAEMGFPVVHRHYLDTLLDFDPEIIMLAPPPTAVHQMVQDVLTPYYRSLREKNHPLPDLYAFAPDPPVQYYPKLLGEDLFVVNLLPNMTARLDGDSPACYSVATYPVETPQPEKAARVRRFLAPLGALRIVPARWLTPFLGGYVVCHLILNLAYAAQDGLAKFGQPLSAGELASFLAKGLASPLPPQSSSPENALIAANCARLAWFFRQGILDFYREAGLPKEDYDQAVSVQLRAFISRLATDERETLVQESADHATRGGLLEHAERLFKAQMHAPIERAFAKGPRAPLVLFAAAAEFARQAAESVARYSLGYSGIHLPEADQSFS